VEIKQGVGSVLASFYGAVKSQVELDREFRLQKRGLAAHSAVRPDLLRVVLEKAKAVNVLRQRGVRSQHELQSTADEYDPFA
jgi:hypothetical protein